MLAVEAIEQSRQPSLPLLPARVSACYRGTMRSVDTTALAAALQLQLYRTAAPSRRADIAVELSEAVRETALAGIRRRNPSLSESELRHSFLRLIYGVNVTLP